MAAKKFRSYFDNQSNSDPIFFRQKMYAGLKILHRNGFLLVKYQQNNSRLFLYYETQKLKKFRDKILLNDYENIFTKEREKLNINLEKFKNLENLIDEIIITYPRLKHKLLQTRKDISLNKKNHEIKVKTLNDLLEIILSKT